MIDGMHALSLSPLSMRASVPAAAAGAMTPSIISPSDIPPWLVTGGRWRAPLVAMAGVQGAGSGSAAEHVGWERLDIKKIMKKQKIAPDQIHPFIMASKTSIFLPPTRDALMSALELHYKARRDTIGQSVYGDNIVLYSGNSSITGQKHERVEFNMGRQGCIEALYCFSGKDGRLLFVFLDRIVKLSGGVRFVKASTKTIHVHAMEKRKLPSEDEIKRRLKDIFFLAPLLDGEEARSPLSVLARNALLLMAEMDDESFQSFMGGTNRDKAAWLSENLIPRV